MKDFDLRKYLAENKLLKEELRDVEDILVKAGFRFDDELPFELVKGDHIFITKHRIHRIHKGTTDLKIKING